MQDTYSEGLSKELDSLFLAHTRWKRESNRERVVITGSAMRALLCLNTSARLQEGTWP